MFGQLLMPNEGAFMIMQMKLTAYTSGDPFALDDTSSA